MINNSLYRKISILILVLFIWSLIPVHYNIFAASTVKVSSDDKRACWISFLDIEDLLCDLDKESYICKLDEMYDTITANHMNTVIFHVRPMCDAVYPSEYFPWSKYISSDRGTMNFDPLVVAVEEAHKKGLKFEAWINPYRVSKNNETTESFKQTPYYELYKSIIVEYYNIDGELCMSLDPAREESVRLICDGVREIVGNYDVDAIHFDDYFYVDGMCDNLSEEEKRNNINYMVSSVYKTIKDIRPLCEFGISPAGNIENAKKDGADIETWMSQDGYVDYIMPQLYWSDEFITLDGNCVPMFSKRCEEWQNINILNKPIYAGLALYKANEESVNDVGWINKDNNLASQCKIAYGMGYDGFALFRYAWLKKDISTDELNNYNVLLNSLELLCTSEQKKNDVFGLEKNIKIEYRTYCKRMGIGYLSIRGELSNIFTLFKGMGSISISVDEEHSNNGGIEYRTHIIGEDWTSWVKDGNNTDHYGDSFADGVQIRFYGVLSKDYDVFYRIIYFDKSTTEWKCNGEVAGEMGIKGAVCGVEIKIELKNKENACIY